MEEIKFGLYIAGIAVAVLTSFLLTKWQTSQNTKDLKEVKVKQDKHDQQINDLEKEHIKKPTYDYVNKEYITRKEHELTLKEINGHLSRIEQAVTQNKEK